MRWSDGLYVHRPAQNNTITDYNNIEPRSQSMGGEQGGYVVMSMNQQEWTHHGSNNSPPTSNDAYSATYHQQSIIPSNGALGPRVNQPILPTSQQQFSSDTLPIPTTLSSSNSHQDMMVPSQGLIINGLGSSGSPDQPVLYSDAPLRDWPIGQQDQNPLWQSSHSRVHFPATPFLPNSGRQQQQQQQSPSSGSLYSSAHSELPENQANSTAHANMQQQTTFVTNNIPFVELPHKSNSVNK
ncbi:hypothetical protein CLU79DRAFT_735965 [Phycomyces nitens]|nr:hypothetical protein CLU79DRAFT_735965 [Phycomyces nitens]